MAFLPFPFCSQKLSDRQASRRDEGGAANKNKTKEPFFPEAGKNALIITGSWLVRGKKIIQQVTSSLDADCHFLSTSLPHHHFPLCIYIL